MKRRVMVQGPYGPPREEWWTLDDLWKVHVASQIRGALDQGAAPMKPPPVLGSEPDEAS